MRRLSWLLLLSGLALDVAGADVAKDIGFHQSVGRDVAAPEVAEEQAIPPAFPQDADLIEFYVSAATPNRFFIDGSTLKVGRDGVVRYALVVKAAGGATNVSYEGIRCKTGEYRLYATGRADRSWGQARISDWRPIENKPANRHHAALNRDLFCPLAIPISSADEGRDALRRGKNPKAP
ncbi:MAG TPA: CNP1-like family protein [Rhodocyclaceae bacterium]|nr:CNP1-like family protein [Rhodocyclaceae bacterium]